MTRAKLGGLLFVLALAFVAGGCNDQDKNTIKTLQDQNQALSGQNKQLMDENAKLISDHDLAIKDRDDRIKALQDQLVKGPKTGPTVPGTSATGWETGLVGDRVTLESDILFSAGKADLTAAGKGKLDKIAGDLKKTYAGMPVRVYGYTDTDPIVKTKNLWTDNLDLSSNRAMTVTRYLIAKGIKAETIETVGMGQWHPQSTKAKSRRVDIVVIKASKASPAAPLSNGE